MKRLIKNLAFLALSATFLTGTLAGCGSNNNTQSPSDAVSDEESGGNARSGDNILRYGQNGFDGNFNSIIASNVFDRQITRLVYDNLVKNDAQGNWHPWLAESIEMEDDNHTYVFTLHDNVYFSDGVKLTTEDVAFTFKTIAHPDYNGPRLYAIQNLVGFDEYFSGESEDFEGIQIVDERTIKFTFQTASPANIETFDYGILPKHYYEFDNYEDFLALLNAPMGSGPLILTSYQPEQYIELVKNENYWNNEVELKIDGVLVTHVPNESALGAIQTGLVDFVEPDINPENWAALQAMPGVRAYNFLGNGYTYLCFNTQKETLNDERVRQALMYALDRNSFNAVQYGEELADVGTAAISPMSWAFPEEDLLNEYDFDMDRARELMSEAGWEIGPSGFLEKDGTVMRLNWFVYTDTDWPLTLASMAADTWGQLGVDLNIELMDFVTTQTRTTQAPMDQRDFDIYTMGFSLSVDPDPSGGILDYDQFRVGGYNASGYYNERAQELIELGRNEFDQEKRAEYYREWAMIMNEAMPTAIIAYRHHIWGISERVSGLEISAFCDWTYSIFDIELN